MTVEGDINYSVEDELPVVSSLTVGAPYNFKDQPERLKYIGKYGAWHQFEKIGERGVWAEILDEDLYMIEETKAH
jgi:hypothetical protein